MEYKYLLWFGFAIIISLMFYQVWKMSKSYESENSPMLTVPEKSKLIIVNYYATWCPASIAFLPTWERFAEEVRIRYPYIKTRSIVCEGSNEKKCSFKGINAYPTVVMYKNKDAIVFDNMGRTLLNLHKFVEDNL
jgi:thiol-disulfide isomerase/thioredoxin